VPAFFFAGGLTADNVAFAVQSLQPTAVDVASGVESSAGKKDATKMKDFCDAVKNVSKSEARRS
jgi:phosphoribosylanthranilate isomerase